MTSHPTRLRAIQLWTRRAATASMLCAPLLLAACAGDSAPRSYAPPDYSYLGKININVASVDIDEANPPVRDPRDMAILAPNKPADVLRQMARDRLVPNASSGRAVFTVDEASIVPDRDKLRGSMAVRLEVATSDGTKSGFAEARITRTTDYEKDGPNATRATLDALITQMMADMNVEFEYQVRRSLRGYLQAAPSAAPVAKPVQTEELAAPAKL